MEKIGNPLDGALSTPADPYTNTREDLKQQIVRNQKYFHPRCADDDLIRAPPRSSRLAPQPPPPPLRRRRRCAAAAAVLCGPR
eukprot:scaffold1702_cov26-Phaeocystis_antarctica.AAC.1